MENRDIFASFECSLNLNGVEISFQLQQFVIDALIKQMVLPDGKSQMCETADKMADTLPLCLSPENRPSSKAQIELAQAIAEELKIDVPIADLVVKTKCVKFIEKHYYDYCDKARTVKLVSRAI
ncbi:hypothetical protein [Pseudaquidulcibacter saccharophilus]|uniref:hypothetical protein n=1 Tax=Pseudaquidulcibacter saccharophilus TaxID=2831900 RepID=UPI001EFF1DED|nr:hypothetical protein [Pseudaquidulcibacter saccharophilus]